MSGTTLRCGTRGSALALAQTASVVRLLQEKDPDLQVETVIIETDGDRLANVPLADAGGKGLFVEKIEEAMKDGTIDFAVHSGKDLPTVLPAPFLVAATPMRGDRADVLLTRAGTPMPSKSYEGFVIGTSSERRRVMAELQFPGCRVQLLRGNITTRIEKLRSGEYDGILLAAAGLDRLKPDLGGLTLTRLDPSEFIPAAGQGILACEAMHRTEAVRILKKIDHAGTHTLFDAERKLMQLLNAGCHSAAGVCADYNNSGSLTISAFYQQPVIYRAEPDIGHLNEALRELAAILPNQEEQS